MANERPKPAPLPAIGSTIQKPNIYSFSDYRDYLRASYDWRRSFDRHFSISQIARRLKVDPSFIKQLFRRRKNIRMERLDLVISIFKLEDREAIALFWLAMKSITESEQVQEFADRSLLLLKTQSLSAGAGTFNVAKDEKFNGEVQALVSESSLYLLWVALALIPGFENTPDWIRANVKIQIPSEQIKAVCAWYDANEKLKEVQAGASFDTGSPTVPGKSLNFDEIAELVRDRSRVTPFCATLGFMAIEKQYLDEARQEAVRFSSKMGEIEKKSSQPDMVLGCGSLIYTLLNLK